MHTKLFFVFALVSSVLLAGCAVPPFPDGRFCTMVYKKVLNPDGSENVPLSLEQSYGSCSLYSNPEDTIHIPAVEMFREKYESLQNVYFVDILEWSDEVENIARKRCK